jgi:plasmid stabilization system protein ParE
VSLRVRFSYAAREQVRDLIQWRRENRPDERVSLARELKRVVNLIAASPEIGVVHRSGTVIRRLRLRRTPYQIFWEVHADSGTITVLAVWSGMREEGPPLP